jgi:hypothetical protein
MFWRLFHFMVLNSKFFQWFMFQVGFNGQIRFQWVMFLSDLNVHMLHVPKIVSFYGPKL